jgi:serine phosphatase RsbU (regulator of sigma subunit)
MAHRLLSLKYIRGKQNLFIAASLIILLGFILDYLTYGRAYSTNQTLMRIVCVGVVAVAILAYFFSKKSNFRTLFSVVVYTAEGSILFTHLFFRDFFLATNFSASSILSRDLFLIYCLLALTGFITGKVHIILQGFILLFIISLYAFFYKDPFIQENYSLYSLTAISFSVVMYFFVSHINKFIHRLEDVTKQATSLTKHVEEKNSRLEKYLNALIDQSRSKSLSLENGQNQTSLFERLIIAAAENLKTQRVSIWLFNADKSALIRSLQYDDKVITEDPYELDRANYPNYFEAIQTQPFILAKDAVNDHSTKEFTTSYLIPLGIKSMLDCPIIIDGESIGVICCEYTAGYADWGNEEVLFIESLSDFISLHIKNKRIQSLLSELNLKNQEIHLKNTEIIDSITYAKRIQKAILPAPKLIEKYTQNTFILYKPKDIIAGDFYWMEDADDHFLFAVADCTGHGVPGALVSVVCEHAIASACKLEKKLDPGLILNKTRELVIQQFEKSDEDVKDGMDISLCILHLKTNQLLWSGANRPLWLVRNNELHILSGDHQHIGKPIFVENFKTHSIQLEKDDMLYLFTDGYIDQFGGPEGKKFKTAKLRKLLTENASMQLQNQKSNIEKVFEDWKGDYEQVDDVCMVGYRI